ncbi:hypothetical protein BaRGS_00031004, partial [Batillaria attramentaria]
IDSHEVRQGEVITRQSRVPNSFGAHFLPPKKQRGKTATVVPSPSSASATSFQDIDPFLVTTHVGGNPDDESQTGLSSIKQPVAGHPEFVVLPGI